MYPPRYLQLSCELFRQPLLVPNNAKSLHFYQIVHLTNFLIFSLININQNIRNKKKIWKNYRGVLTKLRICQLLVILFSILNFIILCSSFILMFSYTFMRQASEIIFIFIKGLNFYLVPWLVVQDIWQLIYRLFFRSNHFSFLLFLTYSFYVFINILNIKIRYFEYL